MFLWNWLKRLLRKRQSKTEWQVPFLKLRYIDEPRNVDVRMNMALIGIDQAREGILEETIMQITQGFINAVKQELQNGTGNHR
jgi:hypothetical protein